MSLSLFHRPLGYLRTSARVFSWGQATGRSWQTSKRALPFSKTKQKLSIIHLDFYRLFFWFFGLLSCILVLYKVSKSSKAPPFKPGGTLLWTCCRAFCLSATARWLLTQTKGFYLFSLSVVIRDKLGIALRLGNLWTPTSRAARRARSLYSRRLPFLYWHSLWDSR